MMYEVLNYRGEAVSPCWHGGMLELISDKDLGIPLTTHRLPNQTPSVVILARQLTRKVQGNQTPTFCTGGCRKLMLRMLLRKTRNRSGWQMAASPD